MQVFAASVLREGKLCRLALKVADRCLYRFFCQRGAVKLGHGELQIFSDVIVANLICLFDVHAFEHLGDMGATCNRGAATECLKDGLLDSATLEINLDLELDDFTAIG